MTFQAPHKRRNPATDPDFEAEEEQKEEGCTAVTPELWYSSFGSSNSWELHDPDRDGGSRGAGRRQQGFVEQLCISG